MAYLEGLWVMLQVVLYFLAIGIAVFLPLVVARIMMWKYPKFDRWVRDIWPSGTQKRLLWVIVPLIIIFWRLTGGHF